MRVKLRQLTLTLLIALALGTSVAQIGWTVGPQVPIERTTYWLRSDGSSMPPCQGGLWLDPLVHHFGPFLAWVYGRLGFDVTPTAASYMTGGVLNALDNRALFQTFANCADICARVPLDAKRILRVQAYVSNDYYSEHPSFSPARLSANSGLNSFGFDATIETSQVSEGERMVCVEARNWLPVEDHVAYIVVYWER